MSQSIFKVVLGRRLYGIISKMSQLRLDLCWEPGPFRVLFFSNLFVLDVFTKKSHNLLAYCIENRQSQPVRVSNLRLALDPYLCPHLNPSSYTPIRDGLDILGKKFTRNEKTFNRLRASIIKELTKSVLVSSFSSFE